MRLDQLVAIPLSTVATLLVLTLSPAQLSTQNPEPPAAQSALNPHPMKARPLAVSFLFPEQVTIAAGKITPVDLHFKVADGLHVNSHTPHTEDLIPTSFELPASGDVQLLKSTFPPGTDFHFSNESATSSEKLSVYTGEFVVHTELRAKSGNHLVEAKLRYQACDNQTCMPPHTIPVAIDVVAR